MARAPPSGRQNTPLVNNTAADTTNKAMKDPKSLTGKRSNKNNPTNYMNITVKREKLDTAEQTRQSTKECEYMIINGKPENLYDSDEVIEIEHLDKEETMDRETERQMMAKFHRKAESSITLMGTHRYIKDGKGGVNPTALAKPEAVYVKKFWEAELKKQGKKTSSLAVSAQKLKSKALLVTPTKKPNKVMKKVDFVPLSSN